MEPIVTTRVFDHLYLDLGVITLIIVIRGVIRIREIMLIVVKTLVGIGPQAITSSFGRITSCRFTEASSSTKGRLNSALRYQLDHLFETC